MLTIQDGGIMHLGADFTTKTGSLVDRASVMNSAIDVFRVDVGSSGVFVDVGAGGRG
jgi:hypothetical protein